MKKMFLFSTILATMVLLFVSCGSDSTTVSKSNDVKELIIAQEGEPRSLDPHKGNDGYSLKINKQIYSRLVEVDGDMNISPGLAQSWTSIDDRTTEFKLRKDIKFHNSELLTAEDVKYSIERMIDSPRISFVVPPISNVEIIDNETFRIITSEPFGPLLYHLAHPALGIVNKKSVETNGANFVPVGTGPFKFKEWKSGDRVILERNDNYFLTNATFERLVFRNIVESSNRAIGLETKELHVSLGINPIDVSLIEKNKNLKLMTKASNSFSYIGMNNQKAPFNDVRVRQAINYAIDKESIVNSVLEGYGKIATSPISPGVFGFTDKTTNTPLNLKKAKELMKEAGFENGFSTKIFITGGELEKQSAEIVQSNLREIGIDLTIEVLEGSAYFDMTSRGAHDMYLASWGTVTGDADYGLYSLFHSKAHGAPGNRDFYSNQEVDNLLDEARKNVSQSKRKELYEKIQIKIVEDTPNVMLYNRVLLVGALDWVQGVDLNPVTLHDFYPAYVGNEKK